MSELKTDAERMAEAKKAARRHNRELEALRADYATTNEIRKAVERHDRETAEILGDLNQPCVGSTGGPTA